MTEKNQTDERPDLLIERHIPVAPIGVECQRERGVSSALPPLYYLHVWWARRPLTSARTAILASLLPQDTDDDWFLKMLGIQGDPVRTKTRIQKAKKTGEDLGKDPYGYNRVFQHTPDDTDLTKLFARISDAWGDGPIRVLDPMSGGGSIPFESARYGFETYANELNPVAYSILKGTIEYPAEFGKELIPDLEKYGRKVYELAEPKLAQFYPKQDGEKVHGYIWARTVKCPECGLKVPLSPNWWLQKGARSYAVQVSAPDKGHGDICQFKLLTDDAARASEPSDGSVSRGTGQCPRCLSTVEGDHIKAEAQEGRMGQQLYALAIKTKQGKTFRLPTDEDLMAIEAAEDKLEENISRWSAQGLVPDEQIPGGTKQDEAKRYGAKQWKELFTPRQLLAQLTHLEALQKVKADLFRAEDEDRARAIATYLGFMFDKCVDYNCILCTWEQSRGIVKHVFQRHDFGMKWSFGEFDHAVNLWPWAINQVIDAYEGLADLAHPEADLFTEERSNVVHTMQGDATELRDIKDESLHLICVDPPYYDNVMYAELSDFFYVWQKRTLGDVYPEAFDRELTDKAAEAVANPARFERMEKKGKMAEQDYETKMRGCFERMHELLRPDGAMTVMFTHKRVEAWDTLAAALIAAGFEITASWPIHTESEHSLHQARKNSAASTILLVCRKRSDDGDGAWWEDIEPELREVVKERTKQYEEQGIDGVDLYVSTFGPALDVISQHWPVRDRSGEEIRPDVALDAARNVVTNYRYQNLLHTYSTDLSVDDITRWAILGWDIYGAEKFPFDEARKLAIATGASMDAIQKKERMFYKRGRFVQLAEPSTRIDKGYVDPEAEDFPVMINAMHVAAVIMKEDGGKGARRFLRRTGLHEDETFAAALEAYLSALPDAVANPGIPENKRRDEWYLRELAQTVLSGKVEVPEYEQKDLW